MVLEKLPRNAAMDGVDLYRRLDQSGQSGGLADPARVDAVLNEVRKSLLSDLGTESTIRGWRAQALFASLVAALDACDLMTLVDTGDIYFEGASVKPADYFLHLRSGERILVDVKSIVLREEDPLAMPVKFGKTEVERMRRFGELFGADVYLALYYPTIPMWTLIKLDDLRPGPGGGPRILVRDTFMQNRIALLGDIHIGTAGPLELVLRPDPESPNSVDDDGQAHFAVGAVELRAGGRILASGEAQRLAFFLMQYGGWEVEERPVVDNHSLIELRYVAEPVEDTAQGFEIVGALSSMYSRLFESSTTGPSGMTALDIDVRPGMLVSLVPHDYESTELPLWRLQLQPASLDVGESHEPTS
jgi:hypothetical protein